MRFALKLTSDQTLAEDLTQDTLLKVLSNLDKFKVGSDPMPWAFSIMRNTFINRYRQLRVRSEIGTPARDAALISISDESNADSPLLVKEIQETMTKLSPDNLECLKLNLKGFKYREISEAVGCPIGTVKSRIFLARKQFIQAYEDSSST